MVNKNKKILYTVLITFLIILITSQVNSNNLLYIKEFLKRKLDPRVFSIIQLFGQIDRSSKKLNNDYNVHFLPKTQFINLDFKKIDLSSYFSTDNIVGYADHLKIKIRQVFYIDLYENNIIFLTSNGKLTYNNYEKIIQHKKLKNINTNLNLVTALDLLIDKKDIFISGVVVENKCAYLVIYQAKISDLENLKFKIIFKSNECMTMIQSGRLSKSNKKNSLLIATAADILVKGDETDSKPQNDNSIYGKILEIDLESNNYKIFSKGHRNILGLYIDEEVILSTEHGPKGGDEINKIILNGNYGWPIVSYGEKYYSNSEYYANSHDDYSFVEPIYSFIPSVGISQIVKVGKNFSKKWKNNFLIASLNGNHLYRIKFDKKYEKIIFIENIYIGERIRDLVYFESKNIFLITLENSGSLGILKH